MGIKYDMISLFLLCSCFIYTKSLPVGLRDLQNHDVETSLPDNTVHTFWPYYLCFAFVACAIFLLVGCLDCCKQHAAGFKEFRNSATEQNGNGVDLGFVNPLQSSIGHSPEITGFSPFGGLSSQPESIITFEPLPHVIPHRFSNPRLPLWNKTPTASSLCIDDWFGGKNVDFPRQQLHYLRECGQGWFGKVVEGEARGILPPSNKVCHVLVRILKEDASSMDQALFLHEAKPYRDLAHPNILKLLGRCLENVPFLLVYESCSNGDLKSYLKRNVGNRDALVAQGTLLRMAVDVASGLNHMLQNGFVHTDVAARNCLVTSDLRVKVGDYGIGIQTNKEEYYCTGDVALPIRWCAPETLKFTETTIETKQVTGSSCVWSYGVLLWELEEWGELPYKDLTDDQIIIKVFGDEGVRLPFPSYKAPYSPHIYAIMEDCWKSEVDRPSFIHIINAVATLLHKFKRNDFEYQWQNLKPNTIPTIDSSDDKTSRRDSDSGIDLENSRVKGLPHMHHNSPVKRRHITDDCSSSPSSSRRFSSSSTADLFSSSFSLKQKSPSLENLHGSLDNLSLNKCVQPNRFENGEDFSLWFKNGKNFEGMSSLASDGENNQVFSQNQVCSFQLGPVSTDFSRHESWSNQPLFPQDSLQDDSILRRGIGDSLTDTEEEIWRKRIERCEFTEKVKEKSKSVADLMILTHIDCSESSESDSLPSLTRQSSFNKYMKKITKNNQSLLNSLNFGSESNLPVVEKDNEFQDNLKKLQVAKMNRDEDSLTLFSSLITTKCDSKLMESSSLQQSNRKNNVLPIDDLSAVLKNSSPLSDSEVANKKNSKQNVDHFLGYSSLRIEQQEDMSYSSSVRNELFSENETLNNNEFSSAILENHRDKGLNFSTDNLLPLFDSKLFEQQTNTACAVFNQDIENAEGKQLILERNETQNLMKEQFLLEKKDDENLDVSSDSILLGPSENYTLEYFKGLKTTLEDQSDKFSEKFESDKSTDNLPTSLNEFLNETVDDYFYNTNHYDKIIDLNFHYPGKSNESIAHPEDSVCICYGKPTIFSNETYACGNCDSVYHVTNICGFPSDDSGRGTDQINSGDGSSDKSLEGCISDQMNEVKSRLEDVIANFASNSEDSCSSLECDPIDANGDVIISKTDQLYKTVSDNGQDSTDIQSIESSTETIISDESIKTVLSPKHENTSEQKIFSTQISKIISSDTRIKTNDNTKLKWVIDFELLVNSWRGKFLHCFNKHCEYTEKGHNEEKQKCHLTNDPDISNDCFILKEATTSNDLGTKKTSKNTTNFTINDLLDNSNQHSVDICRDNDFIEELLKHCEDDFRAFFFDNKVDFKKLGIDNNIKDKLFSSDTYEIDIKSMMNVSDNNHNDSLDELIENWKNNFVEFFTAIECNCSENVDLNVNYDRTQFYKMLEKWEMCFKKIADKGTTEYKVKIMGGNNCQSPKNISKNIDGKDYKMENVDNSVEYLNSGSTDCFPKQSEGWYLHDLKPFRLEYNSESEIEDENSSGEENDLSLFKINADMLEAIRNELKEKLPNQSQPSVSQPDGEPNSIEPGDVERVNITIEYNDNYSKPLSPIFEEDEDCESSLSSLCFEYNSSNDHSITSCASEFENNLREMIRESIDYSAQNEFSLLETLKRLDNHDSHDNLIISESQIEGREDTNRTIISGDDILSPPLSMSIGKNLNETYNIENIPEVSDSDDVIDNLDSDSLKSYHADSASETSSKTGALLSYSSSESGNLSDVFLSPSSSKNFDDIPFDTEEKNTCQYLPIDVFDEASEKNTCQYLSTGESSPTIVDEASSSCTLPCALNDIPCECNGIRPFLDLKIITNIELRDSSESGKINDNCDNKDHEKALRDIDSLISNSGTREGCSSSVEQISYVTSESDNRIDGEADFSKVNREIWLKSFFLPYTGTASLIDLGNNPLNENSVETHSLPVNINFESGFWPTDDELTGDKLEQSPNIDKSVLEAECIDNSKSMDCNRNLNPFFGSLENVLNGDKTADTANTFTPAVQGYIFTNRSKLSRINVKVNDVEGDDEIRAKEDHDEIQEYPNVCTKNETGKDRELTIYEIVDTESCSNLANDISVSKKEIQRSNEINNFTSDGSPNLRKNEIQQSDVIDNSGFVNSQNFGVRYAKLFNHTFDLNKYKENLKKFENILSKHADNMSVNKHFITNDLQLETDNHKYEYEANNSWKPTVLLAENKSGLSMDSHQSCINATSRRSNEQNSSADIRAGSLTLNNLFSMQNFENFGLEEIKIDEIQNDKDCFGTADIESNRNSLTDDDSDGAVSTSNEFVWQKYESPEQVLQNPLHEIVGADIHEDNSDSEGEDDEDAADFTPSSWNSTAIPNKSALRSPERRMKCKKNVSFKKQKYHCVYEYPKEESHYSVNFSDTLNDHMLSLWNIESSNSYFRDYSVFSDWELDDCAEPSADDDLPSYPNINTEIPKNIARIYSPSGSDYDNTSAMDLSDQCLSIPFIESDGELTNNNSDDGCKRFSWSDTSISDDISSVDNAISVCESNSLIKNTELSEMGELRHTKDKLKLNFKESANSEVEFIPEKSKISSEDDLESDCDIDFDKKCTNIDSKIGPLTSMPSTVLTSAEVA